MRAQLARDLGAFDGDLLLELRVVARQLIQLRQVAGAALEPVPRRDQLAMLARLTRQLTGAAWIVPRPGLGQLGV